MPGWWIFMACSLSFHIRTTVFCSISKSTVSMWFFFGNFGIWNSVLPRKKSSPRVSTRLWWFKITGDVSCWWSGILCRFIHSSRSLWQEWRSWKTIEGAILEGEILIDWFDALFSPDRGCFRGKNWDVCSKELLKKGFVVKVWCNYDYDSLSLPMIVTIIYSIPQYLLFYSESFSLTVPFYTSQGFFEDSFVLEVVWSGIIKRTNHNHSDCTQY